MKKGKLTSYLFNIAWMIVMGGFLLAFARLNNINSIEKGIKYARIKSLEVQACYDKSFAANKISCSLSLRIGSYNKSEADFNNWKNENNLNYDDLTYTSPGLKLPDTPKIELPNKSEGNNIDTPEISTTLPGFSHLPSSKIPRQELIDQLNSLNEVEKYSSTPKYSRGEWKHWASVSNCWDVREDVLNRQGSNVDYLDSNKNKTTDQSKSCWVNTGKWEDPYSDEIMEDPAKVDIDHIVPLKAASEAGGNQWDKAKKAQYANDYDLLIISSSKQNRTKGAKTPSEWMPPRKESHCEYAKAYTYVLHKYNLNITKADKTTLETALYTCKG